MPAKLLTAREVADWLGYSVSTIRVWARQDKIPWSKPGGPNGEFRFDPVRVAASLEVNASEDTWAPPPLARIRRRAS